MTSPGHSECTSPLVPYVCVAAVARAVRPSERIECLVRQCGLKMADGLCSGEQGDDVNENKAKECIGKAMDVGAVELVREKVTPFYMARSASSDHLFGEDDQEVSKIIDDGGFCEEDCRKKRCVDRYDSSESSDRFVSYLFVRSHRSLARPLPCYILLLLLLKLRVCTLFFFFSSQHFLCEFHTTTYYCIYIVSTTL